MYRASLLIGFLHFVLPMPLTSSAPLKILIVDDDRASRVFLKMLLSKSGHMVLEAGDGREAIEAYSREQPDLILMDVSMPIMNGYEAAVVIKQRSSNNFVPIIFLTGLNDDESLAECVASGGDAFLSKPVNKVLLGAKVNAMLRISRMTRELELYKKSTEEEIELTHYVFDSLTKRMSANVIPGLDYWLCSAGHFCGDLMIYDKSPSGELYLMLSDFTGHGFSAAIGAIPVSDVFFAMTRRGFKAADILIEINRKLREIMPSSHFCATAFVSINPGSGLLEIFNGGLPPIMVLDGDGNIKDSVKSSNLALGILPAELFGADIYKLENAHDSTLVLYSDGLTEAKNVAGEMFGEKRLHACLGAGSKPFDSIKATLQAYIGLRPLSDDISLVTLTI